MNDMITWGEYSRFFFCFVGFYVLFTLQQMTFFAASLFRFGFRSWVIFRY